MGVLDRKESFAEFQPRSSQCPKRAVPQAGAAVHRRCWLQTADIRHPAIGFIRWAALVQRACVKTPTKMCRIQFHRSPKQLSPGFHVCVVRHAARWGESRMTCVEPCEAPHHAIECLTELALLLA